MRLPEEFTDKMKRLLGKEFPDFLASYDSPVRSGLRINTLKISVEKFLDITPFKLSPVPWAKGGFHYSSGDRPSKHPYYHGGLYYIQEPSAMAPGAVMDAKEGERILDICAAPGGKSTQIAAGLNGKGLLVSNDIDPDRVKALTKNLELSGVKNAVVTNEEPSALAGAFPEYFDKVLVDAPCSGEGMFRKDPGAAKSWQSFSCERCGCMQREILEHAAAMVKPGGHLVYSTCTFSPEEDEMTIDWFLDSFPQFEVQAIPHSDGFSPGRPEWASGRPELAKTVRFWPHKAMGEGHFVALLQKKAENGSEAPGIPGIGGVSMQGSDCFGASESSGGKKGKRGNRDQRGGKTEKAGKNRWQMVYTESPPDEFLEFIDEVFNEGIDTLLGNNGDYRLSSIGDKLYLTPSGLPDLAGVNVIRPGLFLGTVMRGRFEPSNALATAFGPGDVRSSIDLPSKEQDVIRYLKGETLGIAGNRGWVLVTTDGFSLGWAKFVDGFLKNNYPKWWRWSG